MDNDWKRIAILAIAVYLKTEFIGKSLDTTYHDLRRMVGVDRE